MIGSILRRIFERHLLFHLIIPLIVGILADIAYTWLFDPVAWSNLPQHLLSGPRIVLYAGIFVAYLVITGYRIQRETNIGLRQLDLNVLAAELAGAKSLFAIGTMNFDEWFDPAVQVYLATIYRRKLQNDPFRYERIILLGHRSARRNLNSEYLDGYHAKCVIRTHKSLGIDLYFIEWPQIKTILDGLTSEEKFHVGYYPSFLARFPDFAATLWMFFVRRRRVRKAAVGVITMTDGSHTAFLFSKHDQIVSVQFYPEARVDACVKFAEQIQQTVYRPGTTTVQPKYDFTNFF